MNAKEFKNAQRLFNEIEELDKEIIKLDKLAISIVNEEVENTVVSINWTKPKKGEGLKFDEDGSIISGDSGQSLFSMFHAHSVNFYGGQIQDSSSNQECIDFKLNEISSLDLIGGMIAMKTRQRELLIKELNKKGINL